MEISHAIERAQEQANTMEQIEERINHHVNQVNKQLDTTEAEVIENIHEVRNIKSNTSHRCYGCGSSNHIHRSAKCPARGKNVLTAIK